MDNVQMGSSVAPWLACGAEVYEDQPNIILVAAGQGRPSRASAGERVKASDPAAVPPTQKRWVPERADFSAARGMAGRDIRAMHSDLAPH